MITNVHNSKYYTDTANISFRLFDREGSDETGDYVVPNVLSPRDLVSRPDNIDETVLHKHAYY